MPRFPLVAEAVEVARSHEWTVCVGRAWLGYGGAASFPPGLSQGQGFGQGFVKAAVPFTFLFRGLVIFTHSFLSFVASLWRQISLLRPWLSWEVGIALR